MSEARRARARPSPPPPLDAPAPAPAVGENLRRLRVASGLSLQALARSSGVSRAMLGQIELDKSTPTITVIWKISQALGVPFSALISDGNAPRVRVMRAAGARLLKSADGGFTSRALLPADGPRNVEFYELTLAPCSHEAAAAHAPGTTENLVVTSGRMELELGGERYELAARDALSFVADVPHVYRNPGKKEARSYLVISYVQR